MATSMIAPNRPFEGTVSQSVPGRLSMPGSAVRQHQADEYRANEGTRLPVWHEGQRALPPSMATQLRFGQRAQLIQVGSHISLALLTAMKGPPLADDTQVKHKWILSDTPCGSLVAYYLHIIEPGSAPSTLEVFLPIFRRAPNEPLQNWHLMHHLIHTAFCFVVFADGLEVIFNSRISFDAEAVWQICGLAYRLAATRSYPLQHQFHLARRWHRAHFDLRSLRFE